MNQGRKPGKPDFILCIPIAILVGFGLVMVYSASGVQSFQLYADSGVIFTKQLVAFFLGSIALVFAAVVPVKIYRRKSILYSAFFLVLALLIGVLFQSEANGANRWYYLGRFGFQPSDLAKLITILFVACYATVQWEVRHIWRARLAYIVPMLLMICGLILLQPDFGTTMVIIFIAGMMLFLAGLPWRTLALCGLLLCPIVVGLVMTKTYRIQRIKDFVFAEHYQTRQAKLAIGSGGLTGVGLARGKQKLYYLPEPHTDFIFATLGEELGFLGTMTVLMCYLVFLWRGVLVVSRVEAAYPRLPGAGLLLLLTTQALINISIALALFPNKGLTLPFMSAGGTSLIMSLGMCGLLLNISRQQVVGNRVAV